MRKIDLHIHTRASFLDAHFDFSQPKLDEYIEKAALDGIAITNHNLFDEVQFCEIRESVQIPIYPGIEVSVEKGQILVISDGQDLGNFAAACEKVEQRCTKVGDCLSLQDFRQIFGDLTKYLLIPHYEKKPPISDDLLSQLGGFITAGEVSSPKKFMYCMKGADRLVPVYFSDCRIKDDLDVLPVRQTYVDCDAVSFTALRECLRDKGKVALSKSDGNKLFQVLETGQHISTGLNVVLGDRSSGKSHTLDAIKRRFPNVHHIEQFALRVRPVGTVRRPLVDRPGSIRFQVDRTRGRYRGHVDNLPACDRVRTVRPRSWRLDAALCRPPSSAGSPPFPRS